MESLGVQKLCLSITQPRLVSMESYLYNNRYAQVFDNDKYFAKPYPMDKKGKAGDALK